VSKLRDQVSEFHRAFGVPVNETPRVPDINRVDLRLRLIGEEFCELFEATGVSKRHLEDIREAIFVAIACRDESSHVDIVATADAFADLQYVIVGSELEFGIDGEVVLNEVHASNMTKVGGEIRSDGKVLKPAHYRKADVAGVLRRSGWSEAAE
jgi:predicted HAD superfamily Cof-like phosphohydrolase